MNLFSTLALGFTAGLRSMSAPAAASWASRRYSDDRTGNHLSFLSHGSTPAVLTALAVGELIADKLPIIPDRTSPPAFIARIVTGAISGAACNPENLAPGAMLGAAAAAAGTVAGSALRSRLSFVFGRDLPAALVEDALVVLLLSLAVSNLRPQNSLADARIDRE